MDEKTNLHLLGIKEIDDRICLRLPKHYILFFTRLLLCILLTGCTGSELVHQIDRAEQKWNRMGIDNYSIQVQAGGWWYLHNYTVVVREGKVVSYFSTCVEAPAQIEPCKVSPFDPEDFTVPGLFAAARTGPEEFTTVTFHPEYGFPLTIRYDDPQLADEEQLWSVLEFSQENQ